MLISSSRAFDSSRWGENPETYQYWEMLYFLFLKKERGNNIMPVVAHGKQHTHTKARNRKDNLCFYKGYIPTKLEMSCLSVIHEI